MSAPISGGKHPHFSDYRRMPVCTHSTPPFHSSTAGHWGCCPLLAVVSDAAVDMGEHASARIHLQFFRVHDLKGNLQVKSASSFTPGGPSTPSSIVAALFWIATSPASSSVLATSFFPESSHPSGCDVVSHGGFGLHLPDDQGWGASFHVHVGHLCDFLGTCSFLHLHFPHGL